MLGVLLTKIKGSKAIATIYLTILLSELFWKGFAGRSMLFSSILEYIIELLFKRLFL